MEKKSLNASQKMKKTRIGEIPVDWEILSLSKIANITTGKKDVNEGNTNGIYPFFTCSQKEYRIDEYSFDTEAVIVAGNAYFNVKYYIGKFDAYQRTYVIDGFKNNLAKYVFYVLSKDLKRLTTNNQGSAVKYIKLKDLTDFQFPLPPINERQKIIDVLTTIDSVIEKTQSVIDQTQILKKGLMQELFTRGIPGRHKKFRKTEIGEIPREWEIQPVRELISLCQYGLSKPLLSEPIGISILRMNNLIEGELNIEDIKYAMLSKEEEQEYLLKPGDLLFNRTNSRDLVGKVAIYRRGGKISFASYLLRLRVRSNKTDPRWLNYYFNTNEIQKKLRNLATPGVSQSNINAKVMQSFKVRTPPLKEQIEIADYIETINKRIKQENINQEGLKQFKSALMQVLLTGEARVGI
jgi:type I restriction enzyme S subunit